MSTLSIYPVAISMFNGENCEGMGFQIKEEE